MLTLKKTPSTKVSPVLRGFSWLLSFSTHEQKFGWGFPDQTQYCFVKTQKNIPAHLTVATVTAPSQLQQRSRRRKPVCAGSCGISFGISVWLTGWIFFFWHTDVCMLFFVSCEWWTAVTSIMDGLCVCLWDRPVIIFQTPLSLSHSVSHRIRFSLHSYLNNGENKFTHLFNL